MKLHTRGLYAAVTAAALALTACGGGDGDDSPTGTNTGTAAGGAPTGTVSVRGCAPENPLIPGNTNETCGGNVLDAVLAKLIRYNTDTAAPELDIAESIEPNGDNTVWTAKLKKGIKFHDGTEVKAKNFVDAWNWVAYGPNAALNSYFLEPVEGFKEVQSGEDPDGDGPGKAPDPKVKTMTGLKVVDDYTFETKLSAPSSTWKLRLGYTAFAPLPDSFFADNGKAYGDKPVGAGPFTVKSYAKDKEIILEAFDGYTGAYKPKVKTVNYKIYKSAEAAYADVIANNLDITDEVPSSALAGEKYKTDSQNRFIEQAEGVIQTVTFPPSKVDPSYDNKDFRKALSMAIDRATVIKVAFNGTRVPATGWTSPVADGYKEGICGDFCTFNAEKAKQLYQSSGHSGPITIAYNADASHKTWVEAVCNSIKNTLGADCRPNPIVDFATLRKQVNERKMKGMFRTGWQMDYPSIENFLVPIYATGASSNDGDYSSVEFDRLVKEAASKTGDEVNSTYQAAEAELVKDFPSIPLWYGKSIMVYSNKVDNVKSTAFGTMDLTAVSVK